MASVARFSGERGYWQKKGETPSQNEQQITAKCLNLLTNIAIVWNTIYIQEVLKQPKDERLQVGSIT